MENWKKDILTDSFEWQFGQKIFKIIILIVVPKKFNSQQQPRPESQSQQLQQLQRGTLPSLFYFFQNTSKLAHLLTQAVNAPNQPRVKVSELFSGKSCLATLFKGYKGKTQILLYEKYYWGGRTHYQLGLKSDEVQPSQPKYNLKAAEWSIARRGRLQIGLRLTWLDLVLLELKLNKVHFAVNFSEAEAEENFIAKYTECNFIPMSTRWQPSSPSRRRWLLGCLRVYIGTESVSYSPFSVFLFVSTPGPSCHENVFVPDIFPFQNYFSFIHHDIVLSNNWTRTRRTVFYWNNCWTGRLLQQWYSDSIWSVTCI